MMFRVCGSGVFTPTTRPETLDYSSLLHPHPSPTTTFKQESMPQKKLENDMEEPTKATFFLALHVAPYY